MVENDTTPGGDGADFDLAVQRITDPVDRIARQSMELAPLARAFQRLPLVSSGEMSFAEFQILTKLDRIEHMLEHRGGRVDDDGRSDGGERHD